MGSISTPTCCAVSLQHRQLARGDWYASIDCNLRADDPAPDADPVQTHPIATGNGPSEPARVPADRTVVGVPPET